MIETDQRKYVATLPYLKLGEKVQINVAKWLMDWMIELFDLHATGRAYHELLSQTNPDVIFFIQNGEKLFELKDHEERTAKALAESMFIAYFSHNSKRVKQLETSILNIN